MSLKAWTLALLHFVIWSLVLYAVVTAATTVREMSFVKILGSKEPALALPVFAQFIVTQTLFFDRPLLATEIILPLYLPREPLPMKISLYKDGELITWWRYPLTPAEGPKDLATAHLRFLVPTKLEGKIELRFDGSPIVHGLQDHAPRLFTETYDDAYPNGNYRIAANEKSGDIALEVREQKTHYELFMEDIQVNRLGESSRNTSLLECLGSSRMFTECGCSYVFLE